MGKNVQKLQNSHIFTYILRKAQVKNACSLIIIIISVILNLGDITIITTTGLKSQFLHETHQTCTHSIRHLQISEQGKIFRQNSNLQLNGTFQNQCHGIQKMSYFHYLHNPHSPCYNEIKNAVNGIHGLSWEEIRYMHGYTVFKYFKVENMAPYQNTFKIRVKDTLMSPGQRCHLCTRLVSGLVLFSF